jgi:hypothetical protein
MRAIKLSSRFRPRIVRAETAVLSKTESQILSRDSPQLIAQIICCDGRSPQKVYQISGSIPVLRVARVLCACEMSTLNEK